MPRRSQEVILVLSAGVKTEKGRAVVRRGDPLPADAAAGEAERLRALGALGVPEPVKPPGEAQDEASVLAESIAEEVREANEAAEPGADTPLEEGEAEDEASDGYSDEQLAELTAEDAVELARTDPALAERLRALERAREKPRKTVLEALEV